MDDLIYLLIVIAIVSSLFVIGGIIEFAWDALKLLRRKDNDSSRFTKIDYK